MGVYPVILSGGAGSRLWPASQQHSPKQFLPLVGALSTFQCAVRRALMIEDIRELLVVAGVSHGALVAAQLKDLGVPARVLLEPEGRDSGPAMAAAAADVYARDPDGILVLLSADHHVSDDVAFAAAIEKTLIAAHDGFLVTLGIVPTSPATAYGYIRPARARASDVCLVDRFVEKPDAETATRYVREGYLWNAGMFIVGAGALLAELDKYEPLIAEAARKSAAQAHSDDGGHIHLGEALRSAPKISIDYAVVEKTDRGAVLPVDFQWTDLGAWDAVKGASQCDDLGNTVRGHAVLVDVQNCLVRASEGCTIGVIGVEGLAIVAEAGAVLVTSLARSQAVKGVVDALKGSQFAANTPPSHTAPIGRNGHDARLVVQRWIGAQSEGSCISVDFESDDGRKSLLLSPDAAAQLRRLLENA